MMRVVAYFLRTKNENEVRSFDRNYRSETFCVRYQQTVCWQKKFAEEERKQCLAKALGFRVIS